MKFPPGRLILIAKDIDLYLVLLLAVTVAVLGLLNRVSTAAILAAILGTLSILAFGHIRTRRLLHLQRDVLNALAQPGRTTLRDRDEFGRFQDRVRRARTLWLFGPSLLTVFPPNSGFLLDLLRKGLDLRLLVIDPRSAQLGFIAGQLKTSESVFRQEILTTIGGYRDLLDSGVGRGNLELRTTEVNPGFSMVLIDDGSGHSEAIVEMHCYQARIDGRPHIEINTKYEPSWCDFFKRQFELLWDAAQPRSS